MNGNKRNVHSEGLGDGILILAIGGRQDMRRVALTEEEVDSVKETFEGTILVVRAHRDEGDRDVSGDADGVLNIKVL